MSDIPKETDIFKMIKDDFIARYGNSITNQDLLLIGSMASNYVLLCEKKLRVHQHKNGANHFETESSFQMFERLISQQETLIIRQSDKLGLYPSQTRLAKLPRAKAEKIRRPNELRHDATENDIRADELERETDFLL